MKLFNELNDCKKACYKFKIPVKTFKWLLVWFKAFNLRCNSRNNNLSVIHYHALYLYWICIVMSLVQNESRKVLPLDVCAKYFKQALKKFYSIQRKILVKFSSKRNWYQQQLAWACSEYAVSIYEKQKVENVFLMNISFSRGKTDFCLPPFLFTCLT